MAKLLNTTGITYHLEELIKKTNDKLILISPYLQLHHRIKDNIGNLNLLKKDIRIVYRESKLKLEESNWLESQIGVRTSICPNLHAKCYINESQAIVTSMNLYAYSQENNEEMGVLVIKEEDPELYQEISQEAQRLLTISEEVRVSVKKVTPIVKQETKNIQSKSKVIKYLSTKELSHEIGTSSRKVNSWLVDNRLMYKKEEDWVVTPKGKEIGGKSKQGQYGAFIVWPEEITKLIKE
jgi:phosphatidylserine/phosphatidylglycerophosphate/cardiolipin synthase-like enzyme